MPEENKEEKKQKRSEEELVEERKKKLINFAKNGNLWVVGLLIIALILGYYIRTLPMSDHNPNQQGIQPGLWDITTDTWTLGPDLDPFLFLRYAKEIVEKGSLSEIDAMRNVPLGFNTATELQMVSYMIVLTYKLTNLFGSYNINFAGVFMPVLLFLLTIISFFLFVREIFIRKDSTKTEKNKASLIAIISTLFMIVIPAFLSRTVAGIPEKESVAFFFMFLTFYLFLKAWKSQKSEISDDYQNSKGILKSEKIKFAIILGILSGISTGLMGLTWGGVSYIFVTISVASLIAFILNKFHKKEIIIYSLWFAFSIVILQIFSSRFVLKEQLTSLDTGLAFIVVIVFAVHFAIWNTKLSKIKFLRETKLPKNIWSLIFSVIIIILLIVVLLGFGFILEKAKAINQMMFTPVTGRWQVTVAENRQPYFTEWGASFGPFIKGVPILFWLFFIGSVVLFKGMLKTLKKRDAWTLTALYVLFFFGLVFSRYSGSSTFNGENFISKAFYYGSALLLIGSLVYYYIRYHKENNQGFEKIDYDYLLLFSLFVLCLFTARSAVRLIMVLAPIAPIFLSFLIVHSIGSYKKTKDETLKIVFVLLIIILLVLSVFTFWVFYKQTKNEAYSFIPSYYTQQWQKAMQWTRENIPKEAVFGHWWDYGYWVQTIGNRATVLDGGNAISYWNYLMGRFVLTGDNEKDSLDFLYSHNTTHLLIDSTDIGKYGAFSQIGSDKDFDRFSQGPITMLSDSKQLQETRNGTLMVYNMPTGDGRISIAAIEEDIIYEKNDSKLTLFKENSGIMGIVIKYSGKNDSVIFEQPEAVFTSNNQQVNIPLRCIYYNNKLIDYGKGLEACVYILQEVYSSNQGLQVDNFGALMYISPRVLRGFLGQVYLLNNSLGNFPNFKLVHTEQNIIIDIINSQNTEIKLDEFVYYQGIQGPIKIWEIHYTGEEKVKEEYLDTDASKYLSWKL